MEKTNHRPDLLAGTVLRIDGTKIAPEALTHHIQSLMSGAGVLGAAVIVFNNNEIVYKKVFGHKRKNSDDRLQPDTVFYGASLSKPVFSVLVLQLVEEGKLDLDRPLLGYLPGGNIKKRKAWWQDFSVLAANPWIKKITARNCLSHTSGLPNWRWHGKDNALSIRFKPGSRFSYSGEGFCYLQYVIEQITGRTIQSLAREKIFRPLGMRHTSYKWQKKFQDDYCIGHDKDGSLFKMVMDKPVRAASTLFTTLNDYSEFVKAVLKKKILSGPLGTAMFKKQVSIRSAKQFGKGAEKDTVKYAAIRFGYGIGWGVFTTPFGRGVFKEGHGSGFAHYTILFPERGTAMIILSNHFAVERIYRPLLRIAIGDRFSPVQWGCG